MNKFFIKKLGHQELGYKNASSETPGESRGQYFLVSKKHLNFFPPLEKEIPQDLQILNIVSHSSTIPAQVKYIYDNDKYHGSTANKPRDEHRINLNLKVNPERKIYHKNDIVILKKETFLNEDGDKEEAYIITRYRELENKNDYNKLLEVIDRKKANHSSRNYANVSEKELLPLIIDYRERIFGRVMSLEALIPETDFNLLKSKELFNGSTFKKNENELKSFEKQIKRIVFEQYNYKCLVSKIGFKWQECGGVKTSWRGITGAHIKPRAHDGEYSAQNIIPLIEPIHQLFDRGIFTITQDYKVEIHKKALQDELLSNFHVYDKMQLDVPEDIELSLDFIDHHRKEVYGNFITGKLIRSF